jgi:predicted kinase
MNRPQLIILCGVPGAGKSTLADHLGRQWGADVFASENFAAELGSAARGPSGDFTAGAIAHAYFGMATAASRSLLDGKLVVVVGSFRSEHERHRFREIARKAEAAVIALRIACSAELAAQRVRTRGLLGEGGPNLATIEEIDRILNSASDIDGVVRNETTIGALYEAADAVLGFLSRNESDLLPVQHSPRRENLKADHGCSSMTGSVSTE